MVEVLERGAPFDGNNRLVLEMRRFQIDRDPVWEEQANQFDELLSG